MFLWRISNYPTLDGRGGLIASARWHSRGHAVVYLAESPAGALIEVLVHLELDPDNLPQSYRLLKAEAPETVTVRNLRNTELPDTWVKDIHTTQASGDEWLAGNNSALLRVPSVIVPETFNVLLNPRHPDAASVRVLWHEQDPWDRRLLMG